MRPAVVTGIVTGDTPVSYRPIFFLSLVTVIKKLTAITVDEDPAGCQRWISRKEI